MRTAAKVGLGLVVLVVAWRSWLAPTADRASPGVAPAPATSASRDPSQVGAGPQLVSVPLMIGTDDSFAKHLLALTNLRLGRLRLEASSRPWGSVLSQSIPPGAAVRAGTRVDLVLAKGSVPKPCRIYWCATDANADAST
jgi:hypothetical protein